MAYLLKLEGGESRSLAQGNSLVLGRDPECDWTLNANGLSRRHCGMRVDGERLLITDLGSVNGVLVGGTRIGSGEVAVMPGQQIELGEARIGVEREDTSIRWRLVGGTMLDNMQVALRGRTDVGREPQRTICLNNPSVSKHHADLIPHADHVTVVDRSSTGTFKNGDQVKGEFTIQSGDRVAFGPCEFLLEPVDAEAPQGPPPAPVEPTTSWQLRGLEDVIGTNRKLPGEAELIVGRDPVSHLLLEHPSVSKKHATLRVDGARVLVLDHSSTGTRVDGEPIAGQRHVSSGARISFGPWTFVLERKGPAPTTKKSERPSSARKPRQTERNSGVSERGRSGRSPSTRRSGRSSGKRPTPEEAKRRMIGFVVIGLLFVVFDIAAITYEGAAQKAYAKIGRTPIDERPAAMRELLDNYAWSYTACTVRKNLIRRTPPGEPIYSHASPSALLFALIGMGLGLAVFSKHHRHTLDPAQLLLFATALLAGLQLLRHLGNNAMSRRLANAGAFFEAELVISGMLMVGAFCLLFWYVSGSDEDELEV